MQTHFGITALISLAIVAIAGCGKKEPEPAPPPALSQDPKPQLNYEAMIGVARLTAKGVICGAMPAPVAPGDELTLVSVPNAPAPADSAKEEYSSVLRARVTGIAPAECSEAQTGHGLRLPGDSLFTLRVQADNIEPGKVYFAVAIPFNAFFRVGATAGARMSGSGNLLNFRICSSAEGLHLTAWDGKPLVGTRVWHRYFYLGHDTAPTCVEKDIL